MEVLDVINRLQNEPKFKEWKKDNKDSFLVHAFRMIDETDKDWQIGYYNKDDTMTTFVIERDDIKITPEEQIFKKPETKIKPLDVKDVKIDFDKALEIATEKQKNSYKKDSPLKRILILQDLDVGNVWNITFVTQCFNTLNFKICSKTGKIKEEKVTSLMSFTDQKK